MSSAAALTAGRSQPLRTAARGGLIGAYRAECRKLSSQLAVRILALVCLIGPFAFAAVLRAQSGSPTDTLFGALVHSSGFAVSLVVLSFAGSWGFPLLAGIVAGDIFSSEDRYGTWKTVLTRSCSRSDLFAGKLLAAATFATALALLTLLASLVAGVLIVGEQSLTGLGGTLLSPWHALGLTVASWLLCIPPLLAFASTAALLSIASRNGIVGVIGPSVVALVMELLALVGAGVWAHMLLVASAFVTWPALFTAHPYFGPLVVGLVVSLVWSAACVGGSWLLLRRRDFAGPGAARGRSWTLPARLVLAAAVLIALIALAGNLGPAGVTAARLQSNITPNFENLTLLQQRLLGRVAPVGTKLNVHPHCYRHGSSPHGPGEWTCALELFIPQPGAVPYQQAPVSYDVSVQSDGCYKAESPPSFIGQQTMRDADGHNVVNPLFTFYGCLNPL